MSDTPQSSSTGSDPKVLLGHYLKALKLPTILREYDKQARQCAPRGSITRASCCGWPSWS